MVRIINYLERIADNGRTFFTLEVQGGIEMIKSKSTGNFYATARKTSIATTFDKQTCKALIGSEIEGSITKEECFPYEHTIKETGEVIELSHKFVFVPIEIPSVKTLNQDLEDSNIFSSEEVLDTSI